MRYRTMSCMLALALIAPAVGAMAEEKTSSATTAQFEALKKLAGDWVELGKNGKPGDQIASSIRVTAAGSVVQETLFPGTPHEMVTMYHLDGPNVVLTHYCILGNQPTMRAEPGKDASRLVFKFVSAGNLKSDAEHHMDHATLTLVDDDHYRAEWISCQDGKPCHTANLDFVRKQK